MCAKRKTQERKVKTKGGEKKVIRARPHLLRSGRPREQQRVKLVLWRPAHRSVHWQAIIGPKVKEKEGQERGKNTSGTKPLLLAVPQLDGFGWAAHFFRFLPQEQPLVLAPPPLRVRLRFRDVTSVKGLAGKAKGGRKGILRDRVVSC